MPPLFVDGVEIDSVFVDGVEQDKVFADGVEVFSAFDPISSIVIAQCTFGDSPAILTSYGMDIGFCGTATPPNVSLGAQIRLAAFNLVFGGDPTIPAIQLNGPGVNNQNYFESVIFEGSNAGVLLSANADYIVQSATRASWTWELGQGANGNWTGSGNRNLIFTFPPP